MQVAERKQRTKQLLREQIARDRQALEAEDDDVVYDSDENEVIGEEDEDDPVLSPLYPYPFVSFTVSSVFIFSSRLSHRFHDPSPILSPSPSGIPGERVREVEAP